MALTKPTVDDVRGIITTALTDPQVLSIIDDAALMVERCVESLDADRQKAIIKWFTAHLISSTDTGAAGMITSMRIGNASESYARATTGEGIKGTSYGQQALALDPNGCLLTIGSKPIKMVVL